MRTPGLIPPRVLAAGMTRGVAGTRGSFCTDMSHSRNDGPAEQARRFEDQNDDDDR